jgi:myo-inositol-1(or 4)-monophosphatase
MLQSRLIFSGTLSMQPLLNIAISAARKAGDLILRHIDQLEKIKPVDKGIDGLVSEVDIKAEQLIIQIIQKAYPQHGILAEESGAFQTHPEVTWIIDPLDGTTNFLHGFPFFAVSIAIQVKGRIEHGVVYDPIRHECFSASRGCGAQLNDKRIRVSKRTTLDTSLLGTGFCFRNETLAEQQLHTFKSVSKQCAGIRRAGAAALDLAYVAAGRLDGFWEFGLKPWDIAAGSLLVLEAGGIVCDEQGKDNYIKTGHILASTPKIGGALLSLMK